MINNEELKKTAELARLYVPDSEFSSLSADMKDFIVFAEKMLDVDTDDNYKLSGTTLESLRGDIKSPSIPKEAILKNAQQKEDCFFSIEVRRHE